MHNYSLFVFYDDPQQKCPVKFKADEHSIPRPRSKREIMYYVKEGLHNREPTRRLPNFLYRHCFAYICDESIENKWKALQSCIYKIFDTLTIVANQAIAKVS
jgi:hypothetical protein